MDAAAAVVMEQNKDGVFLIRYTQEGEFAGDTWHLNLDDAKHQAVLEYGISATGWRSVPSAVDDPVAYALAIGD